MLVVRLRSKELVKLAVGLDAVNLSALEVPAKLQSVTIDGFCEAGSESAILLIQS